MMNYEPMEKREIGGGDYLSIITNRICAQVKMGDIEFLEQDGRKIHVVTMFDEYVCYEKLESLAPILVNKSFFRAKKGLVVNFSKVSSITESEIIFESGRIYSIGRNNLIKTRKAFKSYLLGYPPFVVDYNVGAVAERQENLL